MLSPGIYIIIYTHYILSMRGRVLCPFLNVYKTQQHALCNALAGLVPRRTQSRRFALILRNKAMARVVARKFEALKFALTCPGMKVLS